MIPTAKKSAQQVLDQLPEDADWERIMYALHVWQKIERGLAAAAAEGRTVPHETVRRQLLGNEH